MATAGAYEPDIKVAADLLASAETSQDGWLPASEMSVHGTTATRNTARWVDRLLRLSVRHPRLSLVHACSDRYPDNLRPIASRPALLFVEGDIRTADAAAVAIVGSRNANAEAIEAATSVAGSVAAAGLTVVSGLARGIDTAAHVGALDAQGRTIAVMGTGIGLIFPPENAELSASIPSRGALVTQFPPGHRQTRTTFPARNAVIAGLSRCSLVIVASERSGTRIEINESLRENRPVLLWAPQLSGQRWADELAEHPLVEFVKSPDAVVEAVRANPAQ
jgi:DNA protecting protein DprA